MYDKALILSEILDVKFKKNDVEYIERVINSNNQLLKNNLINFLKQLPIDVLKTLPSNILIKLPTAVFDKLSLKTKMKARTIGRVKTWLGYGGTKKRRASKRRKNNRRSRRIRYT